jgi:hypothetical protein
MAPGRSQFAVKLLPSLTDFAFLMPLAFLFGRMNGAESLLGDGDTGWHIRTGEWILAHHGVPTHDLFSFSKPGAPWFAWEWLSDVLLAWFNGIGGLAAVTLAVVLLLGVTFALLFRLVRRKANPVLAFVVTAFAAAASSIHWLARPHVFTLLFAVLFYTILERVREGRSRIAGVPCLMVLLPVATILWTNLHGGFFVGILMIGGYAAGDSLRAILATGGHECRQASRRARRYAASALLCLAASLVNPYTYRLHAHIIGYLSDPYLSQHINEFFTLSFHHPVAIFFEAMLLVGAAAAVWYVSTGRFTEFLLLAMWGHAALLAGRNVPIFVVIAAPPVAGAVAHWLGLLRLSNLPAWLKSAGARLNRTCAGLAELDSTPRWHLASAAGALLVAALLFAPAPPQPFRAEYNPREFPAAAVETLRGDDAARIFTNDVWGGYLIYRLYPRTRVFVDGRSDFYGAGFSEKYLDILNVKYDWEETLGRFGVNTILLPTSAPLAGALKESARWRVVYDDGVAVVFRSPGRAVGQTISATAGGDGISRDREITKTEARDREIAQLKPRT